MTVAVPFALSVAALSQVYSNYPDSTLRLFQRENESTMKEQLCLQMMTVGCVWLGSYTAICMCSIQLVEMRDFFGLVWFF